MKSLMRFSVLILMLWLPNGYAEKVPNFYQLQELVLDQSVRERQAAMSRALEKMIVRASGKAWVLESLAQGQIEGQHLPDAASLAEAYRYESTTETIERDGKVLPASRLIINFSKVGIENILRSAALPVWSSNRPSVLVWLVKDDFANGRQLVLLRDGSELAMAAGEVAVERGLPLIAPLLDLEDRLTADADSVWSLDEALIREASTRYQPDVIVVGRYSQTSSGNWLGAWSLWDKDRREVFDLDSSSEKELVGRGVATITDYLASRYAILPGSDSGGDLNVELQQVENFNQYVRALSYLESLDIIKQVKLISIDGSRVGLRLMLEGDRQSFIDALELDRKLLPVSVASATVVDGALPALTVGMPWVEEAPLRFRWTQ